MRMIVSCALALSCLWAANSCKKQDDTAPPAAGYPGSPEPQAPPSMAKPSAYAPAPATSASGAPTMAVPGPLAFQCQNDAPCGTHHCNASYGKCAFPCQSNIDCVAPNTCTLGLCVPQEPDAGR
jgi:hypothetical protein